MSDNKKTHFLIVDIGTGNVRVAITDSSGEIHRLERDNVHYYTETFSREALRFDPQELWGQILQLSKKVLQDFPTELIQAITVSSQREGIVILDKNKQSCIGLPNHDHRARQLEASIKRKEYIYKVCARPATSLFSAPKLMALKKQRPEIIQQMSSFMSISDWCQFMFCGVEGYEHSQASETLLYEVENKKWSEQLCELFELDPSILPTLRDSGSILGVITKDIINELGLDARTQVIVGGADTQLAIKSTQPSQEDVAVVAGTTAPVVKLMGAYLTDPDQKTWTNQHIEEGVFILETNAGVTGLNYQRLKEIFYPNECYNIMESEIQEKSEVMGMASLGSLIPAEISPLTMGGFIIDTPISPILTRADFIVSALLDITYSIHENYQYLTRLSGHNKDYIYGCGGGFQSATFAQMLSDQLQKKIKLRKGFQHASIIGATAVCNSALGLPDLPLEEDLQVFSPTGESVTSKHYQQWQQRRQQIKTAFN